MQNNITKFILTILLILFTLFMNSFITYILVIITTSLIILFSIDFKTLLYYLLKIKYLYLLLILVPFNINILYLLIKLTIIYIILICYFKTSTLANRYNTLYNILKKMKLEKYTSNIILFIPVLYKELKKISFVSLQNIFINTKDRLKTLSTRFIGFEHHSIKFNSEDFGIFLIVVLFFVITLYAR